LREKDAAKPKQQRSETLKIDLPFEEAVKAALETPPPPTTKVAKPRKRRRGT
jgi:hypothetical protein